MRAGLLSDPRVVVALRTLFVPVHISALNTAHCLHDPRDEALLRSMAGDTTDHFLGGERETFVLPDGTMRRVFMSLNDCEADEGGGYVDQYTAPARRSDGAMRMFRHHGTNALRSAHGEVPTAWDELWDGDSPAVRELLAEKPRVPEPGPGQQGLRVFVRNNHPRYDDLHGAQILALAGDVVAKLGSSLRGAGDRAELPPGSFVALANAMAPRGTIDPELATTSISGGLEFVASAVEGDRVTGVVGGAFALQPKERREVSKRESAGILFEAQGNFAGRFTWDRAARTFTDLRVATRDVTFAWKGIHDDFTPHYFAAIEWARGASPKR